MDWTELTAGMDGPSLTALSFVFMLLGVLILAIINLEVSAPKREKHKHDWSIDRFGLRCSNCGARPQEDTDGD